MIKILHIRASNFYGGPERQLHLHALQTRESEFRITVGSFSENKKTPEFLNVIARDDIDTVCFEVKNAYDRRAISRLRNYLKDKKISILCTHDYRTHLIGYLARRKTSTRWIAFSRGFTRDDLKVRFFQQIEKILIRFADHIVAVSGAQKQKLKKKFIPSKKISVVHNSVDPEIFKTVEPVDLRQKYNLPDHSVVCISGGRFSREKGHIHLVKAAEKALVENGNLRFILYGDGSEYGRIIQYLAKSVHRDKILCPGFEKRLIGCIKDADLLINPSLSEGLPNIILEAMAVGTPVIATDVGGTGELVENGYNGFLVAAADIDGLAEKIIYCISNKEKLRSITGNALKTVGEQYSFAKQARKLYTIYRNET